MKHYKCPSLSLLKESFPNVEIGNLLKIRSVLLHWKKPCEVSPGTERWVRQCFNEPSWHEQALNAFSELLEGHGVEALRLSSVFGEDGERSDDEDHFTDMGTRLCPAFSYVNMGDTYNMTILRDHEHGAWILASYGDVVEWWEAKHERLKKRA